MKPNISSTDRMIRFLIAAMAAVLYFTHILTGVWGITFLTAGGILLLTSLINFCPYLSHARHFQQKNCTSRWNYSSNINSPLSV